MFWETKKCSYLTYNCLINFSFLSPQIPFVFLELFDSSFRQRHDFFFQNRYESPFAQINYKQEIMDPEPPSATNKFHSV